LNTREHYKSDEKITLLVPAKEKPIVQMEQIYNNKIGGPK
jgi:hypothetical protein